MFLNDLFGDGGSGSKYTSLPGLDGPNRALLVALTGYGREDDMRQSREAGFDHHMVKPVDPQLLEDLLSRHNPLVSQTLE